MAKRSATSRSRKRVKVADAPASTTVQLRLLKSLKVNIYGPVTNTLYVFPGSGSIVEVDSQDVDGMMQKKDNKACCPGSVGPQPYFEIV